MDDVMRGIFAVMQTALKPDGEFDLEGMKKQVDFCIECGGHGLVFPVLGGEFQYLSEDEREQLIGVVVDAAAGRVPGVAGVAGPSKAIAVECTKGAVRAGADAVVALPPYLSDGTPEEVRDYYEGIAAAAQRPVFLQHTSGGLTASFMRDLFAEVEHISYLKEEQMPSAHQISAVVEEVKEGCLGVFGGGHGRWMMSELRRGATGFMPAAEAVDIHVQIWDAFQAGDEDKARKIFNVLLPQINLILLLGLRVCKEILVRRGVLSSTEMRTPGVLRLDAEDEYELDKVMENLAPYYKVNWK
ncbi:MAG: dihydrodipicolinate synthase family protein [Candidatus Latescibacterota bacterium]